MLRGRARRRYPIVVRVTVLLLVPLISLVALWALSASLTAGSALQKMSASTMYDEIGAPSGYLSAQLQTERTLSAVFLAGSDEIRQQLLEQRARTDATLAAFRRTAVSSDVKNAADEVARQRLSELFGRLDRLGELRASVDGRAIETLGVVESYGELVNGTIRLFSGLVIVNDIDIYRQGLALINVNRAREFMLREDALISAAQVAGGRLADAERVAIQRWAAAGREAFDLGLADLADEQHTRIRQFADSEGYLVLRGLEDALAASADGTLPAEAAQWSTLSTLVSGTWAQLINQTGVDLVEDSKPIGDAIIVRLIVAGGLGLVAVVASIVLSVVFARGLARELRELRGAAAKLADERLPRVVERLRRGEDVDVHAEAPPLPGGRTKEVAEVADAFTRVRRTAVETAVGEAQLRQGINRVFLNIAWRSQSLLHRQLRMLDTMERRITDPEVVADLFRLDHLTTRMRRHAEGLVILSGALPGRGWSRPVPIEDVLRSAAAEVEDFTRVDTVTACRSALVGTVVTDVIHLLAELIENATVFSPPRTDVVVRGEVVGNGLAIEVIDRGIGIDPHERAELNQRLAQPPEFDLADSERLGLFVVGRLAARHGIKVILQESPYGGTSAVVLLPHDLIVEPGGLGPGDPVPGVVDVVASDSGAVAPGAVEPGSVEPGVVVTGGWAFPPVHPDGVAAPPDGSQPAGPGTEPGPPREWFEPYGTREAALRGRFQDDYLARRPGDPSGTAMPDQPMASRRQAVWRPPAGNEAPEAAYPAAPASQSGEVGDAGDSGEALGRADRREGAKPRLPRRRKQAHLVPQLRVDKGDGRRSARPARSATGSGEAGEAHGSTPRADAGSGVGGDAGDDPAASRDLMQALQDGWQRGRSSNGRNRRREDEAGDGASGRTGGSGPPFPSGESGESGERGPGAG